jgi:hypothetical protein
LDDAEDTSGRHRLETPSDLHRETNTETAWETTRATGISIHCLGGFKVKILGNGHDRL